MPYVEDGPDGPYWITKAGVNMGLVGGIGSVGGKFVPGQNYRVDKMAETGLYEDGKKGVRRPGDPDQRVKDMDRDGVDAEVIFGILGVASRVRDPEAANEMLRIYNDWLKDYCSHYPDRQIGLACLPYGDIEAAGERDGFRSDPPRRPVHRRRRLSDEFNQHHRRDHRRWRSRALSEPAHRLGRKWHRLASLRARSDGFRV